jgi:hypothetical protein
MFLWIRGMVQSYETYPGSPQRPKSDIDILREIDTDLCRLMEASR